MNIEVVACGLAAVLAFGTLAGMHLLHVHVLAERQPSDPHLLRDGLLLLPLALVAALAGLRARDRRPGTAAARIALLFAALLVPATAAHGYVHAATEPAVAHAASGMSGADEGLTDSLGHGVLDALLALPIAFLLSLAALALLSRRRAAVGPIHIRRLGAVAVSTLAVAGAAAGVPVSGAASPAYPKFSMPLTIPPVLTGQDIQINIAETDEQILPGATTKMWTYNGTFPGPTIRRPTGVPTNVTFTNNLPAEAGSLSVHHHGTQAPEKDDGQPANYLIAPGASRTYSYPGIDNTAPERAAPQWYHDHRDMVTGRNVWKGLVGAFIYDDPFEQGLNLPRGEHDVPLMVADRMFDDTNQIPYTFASAGVFGDVILVNGVPQPYFEVADRRYRFRLYNISNRRDYSFQLSNGQAMTQIGTDSGLLPAPVQRTSIRLGPAERADVVIDFGGLAIGTEVVLQNADHPFGPGDRDTEVMQFRVARDEAETSSPVPATLRPVIQTDTPVVERIWNLDQEDGWTINGKRFDPNRIDAQPVLGTTERWTFRNTTSLPHIAHTHLGDQKLVSRNGQPPQPHERTKESWYLAPGDEVVFDIKFTDHLGKFVFHCHVLEHEDNAMMGQFQTVAPAAPPPPPPPVVPPAPSIIGPPVTPPATGPPAQADTLSRTIRILSSKRLRNILRRGVRFEAAVPKTGSLRAELRVRNHRVGVESRSRLERGRVRVTFKLSKSERTGLTRLLRGRKKATAQLRVTSGGETRTARFTIFR